MSPAIDAIDRPAEGRVDRTADARADRRARIVVMSPGLLTSVTVERGGTGGDEIHIHPAGQGFWVARMVAALGARPVLVTTCGGEGATAAVALVGDDIDLRAVAVGGTSGVYIDDRRSGERQRLATATAVPVDRHAIDDLVSITVAEGLAAGIVVLTGSNEHDSVPPDVFTTLSAGLHALGVTVVVDLSGDELRAVLDGHVDVVKVSDEELHALGGRDQDGGSSDELELLRSDARRLQERSGADIFVTRADAGAFAVTAEGVLSGRAPTLRTVDTRGAGDSFTAALASGRRDGLSTTQQFRLALAAAATNVLRHGLGSATGDAVASMLDRVEIECQQQS